MRLAERYLRACAALCLCLALVACASGARQESGAAVVGQRTLIALLADAQSTSLMRDTAEQDGYQLRKTTALPALGLTMLSFQMPDGITAPEAIVALAGRRVPRAGCDWHDRHRDRHRRAAGIARPHRDAELL